MKNTFTHHVFYENKIQRTLLVYLLPVLFPFALCAKGPFENLPANPWPTAGWPSWWLAEGNVSSLTASPGTICPNQMSTLTANGLTTSNTQWWIDKAGGISGSYDPGTDINLATSVSVLSVTGGTTNFPAGSSVTVWVQETVTVAGMPPTVTVTKASTTLVIRPVSVIPQGFTVCRNDNPENLATRFPTATSFSGPGVSGSTFTPANVMPNNAQNVNLTANFPCPLPDGSMSAQFSVSIQDPPNATIADFSSLCQPGSGSTNLQSAFTNTTTQGGTFTLLSGDGSISGLILNYNAPGCFQVRYTVTNPNGCDNATLTDDAYVMITQGPEPNFTIAAGAASCFETGTASVPVMVTVDPAAAGTTFLWRVTTTGAVKFTIADSTSTTDPGISINFDGAPQYAAGSISICLIQTIPASAMACGANPAATGCSKTICKSFSILQQPDCDTDCPGIEGSDVCDVYSNPGISLSCSVLTLGPLELFFAEIGPEDPAQPQAISCTTDEVCVTYDAQFKIGGLEQSSLPKLKDLPLVGGICDLLQFCICVDLGFLGSIEIRPFGFIPSDFCDDDLLSFILDAFGNGQGYQVWADTDGDGNFDYLVDEQSLATEMTSCIPNNVPGEGKITVRILGSANGKPTGPCQDPATPLNLLDVLPIDAIPIIGPTITSILEALGCVVDVGFSDVADYEVFVYNDQEPSFVNCPSAYKFSDGPNCSAFVNWSAPVATDNCDKTVVADVVQITDPASPAWAANGNPFTQTLTSGQFVTYDTSANGNNEYVILYEATACNGLKNYCSFTVNISTGEQPQLLCPANFTVQTDVDKCSAIVTGLSPLEGLGSCDAQVSWSAWKGTAVIPNMADIIATGTNDASGNIFPVGVNTVQYVLNAPDQNGNPTTATCSFTVTVEDGQLPTVSCQDLTVQLDNTGAVTVTALQVDGGTSDNCGDVSVQIQKGTAAFANQVTFDCFDVGSNTVTLQATDDAGNQQRCLAQVIVSDFFKDFVLDLDVPEICLEANNPAQYNFSNYLAITRPNGTNIPHSLVGTLGANVHGFFGITAFNPAPGSGTTLGTSANNPGDIGFIDPFTGVYTPGAGSGYMTISYLLTIGNQVAQNGALIDGCFKIVHDVFELRQPLVMGSPECMCFVGNERIVDLGIVSGGLEPYRIQYAGTRLDVDGDGVADDSDGTYTYDVANGHNIDDFQQDLGELRVVYTQPTWSFTIVDARGCEIFRSGSCDNDDFTEGPNIPCTRPQVELTTETYLCESQFAWQHPIPTDNCAVTLYDYRIINPDGSIDGPHTLNGLTNLAPGAPLPALLNAEYEFQLGTSVVSYYAEDAQGNLTTCTFTVRVVDNDPPYFINCPYPDVVQDAEPEFCEAYVNFALPLASDNCDLPLVTQIDQTGLHTGDRFPVGLTVLYYQAIDLAGNKDTCRVKVIVNDLRVPAITCPGDVNKNTDPWLCSAVVTNIAPVIAGPCKNNFGVTYSVFADAALTQRKACGVGDASGDVFDKGNSWVRYTVHSQPILLISEVQQSGPVDRIEITNLGPAALDITCLMVTRTSSNPAANQSLAPVDMLPSLAGTIVPVGGVFVFNFAFNGPANLPACYKIAFKGNLIDEVAVNGFAGCGNFTGTLSSGDVVRTCEDDSDTAADWAAAVNCAPLSIGTPNADLDVMPDNGTKTALQSVVELTKSCTFKINVKDVEKPFCGKLDGMTTYSGPGIATISTAACNRSTITVPNGCIIGDVVFSLTGTATPANSKITLISPYGTRVLITELPADTLPAFFAQKSTGVWTLDIVPNVGFTPTVLSWSLKITCIAPFDMADQTINNDLGQCGANFTWKHPYFVDNCFDGTISVSYTTTNAGCVPPGSGLLLGKGGYVTTKFFCVGTTKVTYTLVDAAGNTEVCSFNVTVKDAENPVVTCPQDIFINLSGGECGAFVNYAPTSTSDNCAVVNTVLVPPSGSWFPIGDSIVRITVFDAAGNSATCTFVVHVIEYVPTSTALICNDLSNVSLDSTCLFLINADDALEGDNYHCYDDYIITIKNNLGQIIGNSFNASNIGKVYTITVLDPETGNSCWTTLKIEDKLAPKLVCPPNITIACSESTDPTHTGNVAATDCSTYTKVTDDQFTDFGECASPRARVKRTFIVTDAWSNQSTCSQTITIQSYDPAALVFPPNITVNCETAYLNPNATAPEVTGIPSINGAPIGSGGLCSTSIGHWDERLEICAGSYEIYRTWKVGNTCLPPSATNPLEYVQRIRVKDFAGPAFACPAAVTVSTDPYNCCATAALPDMIISEGCSQIVDLVAKVTGTNPANGNIITFTVNGHLGDFPGNNYWNPDTLAIFPYTQCLPIGNYNVRYTAADQCTNVSQCNFVLTVVDAVPPVAICQQSTTVAVGGNGSAVINASVFDDGSTDNCCLQTLQAGRMQGGSCGSTQLGNTVTFCCADVGHIVQVVFRATDCYGNTNDCMVQVEVQDKIKPNCTPPADVTISCESFDPTLIAYGKAAVTDNCCLDATKKYQGQNGLQHSPSYALFDTVCNRGTIVRRFTAYDCHAQTSSCTQRVVVNYTQDYFVKFPNDVIITVCDGTGSYGIPTFLGKDCELLGTSFEDQVFTVVPDACFKIERTWTVINWCTYDPNEGCVYVPNPNPNATVNHPSNLPGPVISAPGTVAPWAPTNVKIDPTDPTATNYSVFYTGGTYKTIVDNVLTTVTVPSTGLMNCLRYKQIIKIIDTQDPVFAGCPDSLVTVCDATPNEPLFWNAAYYYDNVTASHDLCEAPAPLTVTATDSCAPTGVIFHYQLFLDLNNDGTMETVINSNNPPPANTVYFGNALNANYAGGTPYEFDNRPVPANQKYRFALQTIVNAASKTAKLMWNTDQSPNTFVPAELPYGTHKIKWFVEDGCGNEAFCEYTFVVKDCKAPTVVCLNGLSVNIMPTQMIQLWVTDFLQYAEDNCTPVNQLKYAVRKSGTGTGFPLDAQGQPITNVVFTCADLGTQQVELWAIDASGNADYCETYVIVQDNNGNCPSNGQSATVSGFLKTEAAAGLEEAAVQLDIASTLVPPTTLYDMTDNNGQYGFTNATPLAANVSITPVKDNNPLNGVSTYDLVLISRHILGLEPLTSPYKMIAADANKSGSITTFDIVELRKLILGIYQELPNNTSWRFVDKAFVFPNPNNPFQTVFPENVAITAIPANSINTNFTAVKIGDVNQNALANSQQNAADRTTGTLLIDVKEQTVKAGEVFDVTFKTAEAAQGFQFTLNLLGVQVTEILKGDQVDAGNFGVFDDALTVSVDGAAAFTVTFRALKSGRLSDLLSVSSRITKAEAYVLVPGTGNRVTTAKEVALRFHNGDQSIITGVGFELYQNQPNPFLGKTSIGFHLPAATTATLTVYDESGRVLLSRKGEFAKGYNSISVDAALVIPQATGMLFYKLETATNMATKKMIQSK